MLEDKSIFFSPTSVIFDLALNSKYVVSAGALKLYVHLGLEEWEVLIEFSPQIIFDATC